jgi:hypothetical protein
MESVGGHKCDPLNPFPHHFHFVVTEDPLDVSEVPFV